LVELNVLNFKLNASGSCITSIDKLYKDSLRDLVLSRGIKHCKCTYTHYYPRSKQYKLVNEKSAKKEIFISVVCDCLS